MIGLDRVLPHLLDLGGQGLKLLAFVNDQLVSLGIG
jgi:hypothetical protein